MKVLERSGEAKFPSSVELNYEQATGTEQISINYSEIF